MLISYKQLEKVKLLFPEFWEDSTTKFHSLESFLSYLHVGIDGVHATIYLLQLFY